MKTSRPHQTPEILFSSDARGWNALEADLLHIPPGRTDAPGWDHHVLGMHFGPPVNANCSVGGIRMKGLQKPGDISVVPAGMNGSWEDDGACHILRLRLRPSLLDQVAEQIGKNAAAIEVIPRFQIRDARLEAIGWAIRADLQDDTASDPLYIDLLANALAVRLIEIFTARPSNGQKSVAPRMSARQLKILTEFIETNLDQKLHLADLAAVAGVSATRLKTLFRNTTGTPVHRYVIGRRVEYARALLSATTMPANQIALAAGFAHQSHMSLTMRRVLGHVPGEIARPEHKV